NTRTLCCAFLLLTVLLPAARATPIEVSFRLGAGQFDSGQGSMVIPDSQINAQSNVGADLGAQMLHGPWDVSIGSFSQTFADNEVLRVTFSTPNDAVADRPYVDLNVSVGGSLVAYFGRLGGGWVGTVTSATLHNWSPSSDIPWVVVDKVMHPQWYKIQG